MIHIGVQSAVWTHFHCGILNNNIVDICTTRFYLVVLLCDWRICWRSHWLLAAPCHWLFVSVAEWLGAVPPSQTSWKQGWWWLEPWSLSASYLCLYESMRLIHKYFHGALMTVLGGKCPYLSFHLLLVWHVLQDLVIDQMVVCTPFQYIAAHVVSSRCVCPGCCK